MPAPGIGDRRSKLYRRIAMLIEPRRPRTQRCHWPSNLKAKTAGVFLIVFASSVRLDAGLREPDVTDSTLIVAQPPAAAPLLPGTVFVGRVRDKHTGKPVAQAKVNVRLSATDPATHNRKPLTDIRQRTTAEGIYRFTMTPEQLADPTLFILLDVEHPGYVRERHGLNVKAVNHENQPFVDDAPLERGKAIEARLLTPEGTPAANVKISAYTTHTPAPGKYPELGSFTETVTDEDGHFRLNLLPSGPAVFWILPKDYALSTHVLKNDRRGDLGTINLAKGNAIQGTVVDTRGKAVTGVYVQADRVQPSEFREAGLTGIADRITRSVLTDNAGRFTLHALPTGNYRVAVVEEGRDPTAVSDVLFRRPAPGVFAPLEITLDAGNPPEPLAIRAIPHVVLEARYFDSKGKPCNGSMWFISGRIDGVSWGSQGQHDDSDKFAILAPLGLETAQLHLMLNSRNVLRHRLAKGAPLENGRDIQLGTLDHDLKEIEIVRYVSPIVTVSVVSEDGQTAKNAQVKAEYFAANAAMRDRFILKNGGRSDVGFEEQKDGRFRSVGLLPDEKIKLTAAAEGFEPKSDILSLPEGVTRELTLTLKPK
jgi:uncharacterized GH25 family protein